MRTPFNRPDLSSGEFRRNLIVRGVDLSAWIGKHFRFQGVDFEGSEECKPCYWMDEAVVSGVEDFLKSRFRGGLRARILSNGILRVSCGGELVAEEPVVEESAAADSDAKKPTAKEPGDEESVIKELVAAESGDEVAVFEFTSAGSEIVEAPAKESDFTDSTPPLEPDMFKPASDQETPQAADTKKPKPWRERKIIWENEKDGRAK